MPLSRVSIQMQSLALRALRKRKPHETQALALASSQSWLPLLRPNIPIGWRLRKRLRLNGNRALVERCCRNKVPPLCSQHDLIRRKLIL